MDMVMDIIAVVISGIALALTILQYIIEANRQKKEATLIAYNSLQNEVFSELRKHELSSLKKGDEGWNDVTTCLAKIENFSVGINTGIYSLDIVNRLGGDFFITQFDKLLPVINRKREDDSASKHYDEFEKVIIKLKKKRGMTK